MESPYKGLVSDKWLNVTNKLIKLHPVSVEEWTEIVFKAWGDIFKSKIGSKPFQIGKDISPKPQIMGFLLHELISLEIEKRYPHVWRKERSGKDKDLIFIPDNNFSVEIKTSSNKDRIFGNRSYAQKSLSGKKNKSGYYLTVNFEKFLEGGKLLPKILLIRFGWLDHVDWIGQASATGQQSRLPSDIYKYKLLVIFKSK